MSPLCRCKRRGLIASLVHPHAIDDSHPDVGQGADRHTVGLAFGPFALVIVQRPGFLHRRLPGELMQSVAQWFQAGEAFVRFGVIAALERHRRGSGQRLDTVGVGVARAIIAPFCEQTRGQALACTRQRTPQLLIFMGQKKGTDLLIVGGDILDHDQQLFDQRQHQARLSAHDDWVGDQLGTVQLLDDLGRNARRAGMLAHAQSGRDLFKGGRLSCLGCRVGLQKHEGGALLQLGKQLQGGRIVFLEAGRQLVYQAGLRLDQRILIAGQRFQLGHDGAIRLQSVHLRQVKAAYLGQQMGVNLIGLGSCRFAQLIGRLGVDGIDGDPRFQQERDQQSMVGFDVSSQYSGVA